MQTNSYWREKKNGGRGVNVEKSVQVEEKIMEIRMQQRWVTENLYTILMVMRFYVVKSASTQTVHL